MQNKNLLLTGVAAVLLAGCSTTHQSSGDFEQTEFVTAEMQQEEKVKVVEVPVPVAQPYFKKIPKNMIKAKKVSPEKAISNARKSSLHKSTPEGFLNAMQVFDYMPGALYEIYGSPGYITSILLKPGENVIEKATGDAKFWEMGETSMGAGRDRRTVLILRPQKAGLKTNMMVTTDQRIYMLEVRSLPKGVYNASVSWHYPGDDFKELTKKVAHSAMLEEQVVAGNVNIHDLNYDFSIEAISGGEPEWMPEEAFDDGLKTYIRFSNDLGTTKAPVLYVMSEEGKAEIVNYRVRGNFYVIDRLIKVAELRMGKGSPKIVRVTRKESKSFFGRLAGGNKRTQTGGYND